MFHRKQHLETIALCIEQTLQKKLSEEENEATLPRYGNPIKIALKPIAECLEEQKTFKTSFFSLNLLSREFWIYFIANIWLVVALWVSVFGWLETEQVVCRRGCIGKHLFHFFF